LGDFEGTMDSREQMKLVSKEEMKNIAFKSSEQLSILNSLDSEREVELKVRPITAEESYDEEWLKLTQRNFLRVSPL